MYDLNRRLCIGLKIAYQKHQIKPFVTCIIEHLKFFTRSQLVSFTLPIFILEVNGRLSPFLSLYNCCICLSMVFITLSLVVHSQIKRYQFFPVPVKREAPCLHFLFIFFYLCFIFTCGYKKTCSVFVCHVILLNFTLAPWTRDIFSAFPLANWEIVRTVSTQSLMPPNVSMCCYAAARLHVFLSVCSLFFRAVCY